MSVRNDPSSVRIRDVLLEMRRHRMGLIQTADQLRFSYLAIIEGAKYLQGDLSSQASVLSHRSGPLALTSVVNGPPVFWCLRQDSWRGFSQEEEDDPPEFTPPPARPPPRDAPNGKAESFFGPEKDQIVPPMELGALG